MYSVKEVRGIGGALKGWYCDVARPVQVHEHSLVSEDLDLDLWVSADGSTVLRLDQEDFEERGLSQTDPSAAASALRALDELERLAQGGFSGLDPPTAGGSR